MEAWEHDLTNLLRGLRELAGLRIPKRLRECAAELDKHYVISRYPNGFAEGAPWEHYTRKDAVKRVKSGERIIEWAKVLLRVNREEVIRRLKEFKERVVRKYSNIKSVILVGSVATNTHTVRSDVDVVVIYEGREPNYAYLKETLSESVKLPADLIMIEESRIPPS